MEMNMHFEEMKKIIKDSKGLVEAYK